MHVSLSAPQQTDRRMLRRAILRLAWPVVSEQLLGQVSQMVDMVLVGRLGAMAVAAVGLSNGPYWFLNAVFAGVTVGVTALVSRFTGAKDDGQVQAVTRQAHWLGLGVALVLGALIYVLAAPLLQLMGAKDDVLPMALVFLRTWVPGLVALGWSMSLSAALRGAGDMRTPMLVNLGVNLLNGLLGFGLIYGHFGLPALGLLGGGIGTTVARLAGALVLVGVLLGRSGSVNLRGVGYPDWGRLGQIVRIGWPASLERASSTLLYLIFTRFIAELGTVAFAAHQVAVVAENTTWFFAMGLSTAAATLVGQNLGARNPGLADASAREAMRMGIWVLLALSAVYIFLPMQFVHVFVQDPQISMQAASALRVSGLVGQMPMGFGLVLMGALQGAGDTKPLWRVTALGGGVIRISLIVLALPVLHLGLAGAWGVSALDWWVRVFLFWRRFHSGAWQQASV